jgi:hypothetical protein
LILKNNSLVTSYFTILKHRYLSHFKKGHNFVEFAIVQLNWPGDSKSMRETHCLALLETPYSIDISYIFYTYISFICYNLFTYTFKRREMVIYVKFVTTSGFLHPGTNIRDCMYITSFMSWVWKQKKEGLVCLGSVWSCFPI